jgi:adenosine deaminase
MRKHNIKKMLDLGLCVTVNSDDPAYFGGYISENLQALHRFLDLDYQDIYKLVKNAFQASFISRKEKEAFISDLDEFVSGYARTSNYASA